MSEWWTYHLQDFLLFSSETYYRLIELCNRALWPLHLAMLVAAMVMFFLALKHDSVRAEKAVAAILAAVWLWVGWDFLYRRYTTINWAASWFALAFGFEALLLSGRALFMKAAPQKKRSHRLDSFGLLLFAFAVFGVPLLETALGRPSTQLDFFGITPDPTALATLGILFSIRPRMPLSLLPIPLLWCLISGATLWTMHSPEALLLPIAAALVLLFGLMRRVWPRSSTLDVS